MAKNLESNPGSAGIYFEKQEIADNWSDILNLYSSKYNNKSMKGIYEVTWTDDGDYCNITNYKRIYI